jgi:transposase
MPTDLDGQIPSKHLMRVVSTAIDKMNLLPLEAQYEGTSSFHPKMLLKAGCMRTPGMK